MNLHEAARHSIQSLRYLPKRGFMWRCVGLAGLPSVLTIFFSLSWLREENEILRRVTEQREHRIVRETEIEHLARRVQEMERILVNGDQKPQHVREEDTRKALTDIFRTHGGSVSDLERVSPGDRPGVSALFKLRGYASYEGIFSAIEALSSLAAGISLVTLNLSNSVSERGGVSFDITIAIQEDDYMPRDCATHPRFKK